MACHLSAMACESCSRASRTPRSIATQHMILRGGEVLRFAADLPDAAVRRLPVRGGLLDLRDDDRPQLLGHLLAGAGVQVDRIQQRAPDVVLLLVVGAVADPHRAGVVVPGQVVEGALLQVPLAADAVHDLQVVRVVPADVVDEVEEVVGLPVEAEGVQTPQGEGGVPDPGVPVVPVPFPARGFRQ